VACYTHKQTQVARPGEEQFRGRATDSACRNETRNTISINFPQRKSANAKENYVGQQRHASRACEPAFLNRHFHVSQSLQNTVDKKQLTPRKLQNSEQKSAFNPSSTVTIKNISQSQVFNSSLDRQANVSIDWYGNHSVLQSKESANKASSKPKSTSSRKSSKDAKSNRSTKRSCSRESSTSHIKLS